MDFSHQVDDFLNGTAIIDWSILNLLRYLDDNHVLFSSDSKNDILSAFKERLELYSKSSIAGPRTKDKAIKLYKSADETFRRKEVTKFFEEIDQRSEIQSKIGVAKVAIAQTATMQLVRTLEDDECTIKKRKTPPAEELQDVISAIPSGCGLFPDKSSKVEQEHGFKDKVPLLDEPTQKKRCTIRSIPDKVATLILNSAGVPCFPVNAHSNFGGLLINSRLAYYDRTWSISALDDLEDKVMLFLRPRRFGKSLTLSMLAHFHGIEYKERYDQLFKGLAIDDDVGAGKIIPGQYLVMMLDFAGLNRSSDLKISDAALNDMINNAIRRFCSTYAPYLRWSSQQDPIKPDNAISSFENCLRIVQENLRSAGNSDNHLLVGVKGVYLLVDEYDAFSNKYLDLDDIGAWNASQSLLKGFWARVKASMTTNEICRCFITGVSPLSMTDFTSGFNFVTNVSHKKSLSGLCGLDDKDVLATLRLPALCGPNENKVQEHFTYMKRHFGNYRFFRHGDLPAVFNTNGCLQYLECVREGETPPDRFSNSEVSRFYL